MLWLDSNNGLHDDADGAALALSVWPKGLTLATPAQIQAIRNPPLTLLQAQMSKISIINNACQADLQVIVAPYPPLEMQTWDNQLAEAQAYTANPAAATPTLSAIAAASGQTVASLAASVLVKAAAYTAASGAAVGKRQALTAQINAATTVAQVQAVVW